MNDLLRHAGALLRVSAKLLLTCASLALCVPLLLAVFVITCLEPLWRNPGIAERKQP